LPIFSAGNFFAGLPTQERVAMEWKLHRSGWIEERNFDIEFAEVPEGFHARVRIIGFPPLEDTKNVFPTEALAEKGALTLLKSQFAGTPDLEEK
jgi:hypothetical protein